MTTRKTLLMAAALIAISTAAPAHAAETGIWDSVKLGFSHAVDKAKDWYGNNPPASIEPAAGVSASVNDTIQIPPHPGVEAIEPAAGFTGDDLQIPPPYMGPQSSNDAKPRATSFDNNISVAAFNDQPTQSAEQLAQMAPAAGGESKPDMANLNCDAILKAADKAEEGDDVPDTALIEACETPHNTSEPAQPAFGPSEVPPPAVMPGGRNPLPDTQPAAGKDAIPQD